MGNSNESAIRVKNRDIPKLQRLPGVMEDLRIQEDRCRFIRERMTNITQHLSWTRGGGTPSGLDESFAKLSAAEAQHERMVKRYLRELRDAEAIIDGIQSETMRTFVTLVYIERKSADEVQKALNMTPWGYRRARECVEQSADMRAVVWHERYILDAKNGG